MKNYRAPILLPIAMLVPVITHAADPNAYPAPLIGATMETNFILLVMALIQAVIILTLGSVIKAIGGSGKFFLEKFRKGGSAAMLFLLVLIANDAHAASTTSGEMSASGIFWMLAAANALLFVIMIAQLMMIRGMLSTALENRIDVVPIAEKPSFADNLLQRLTRTVKVEDEKDIELHHEYDGIRELDNVLPPWWLWLFYGTIAWSVLYIVNVHVLDIWPQQIEEYEQEMAQAKADVEAYLASNAAAVDENTATIDPGMIANGKAIFDINCKACHGAAGEGTVGPNLTDDHWKNGGGIKNIFKTVKYGVPERGMIAWKAQLSPIEIHAVSNYIISLHGTDPPNAKAPEGEIWMEETTGVEQAATAGL